MFLEKIFSIFPFYTILLIYIISLLAFSFIAFDKIKTLLIRVLTEFIFTGIPENEYKQIYTRKIIEIITESVSCVLKQEETEKFRNNTELAKITLNAKFFVKLLPSLIKITILDSLKHPVSNLIIFPLFILLPLLLQPIAVKFKSLRNQLLAVHYLFYLSVILFLGYGISNNKISIFIVSLFIFLYVFMGYKSFISLTNSDTDITNKPIGFTFSALGLILAFGSIYHNLYQLNPNNFSARLDIFDSIYFSIITFATVGYGDISPKTHLARFFVSFEIFTSIFVLIFLASAYINWKAKDDKSAENPSS